MIARLAAAPLPVQVGLMIGAPPLVMVLLAMPLVPLAVELAMVDSVPSQVPGVARAVRVVLAATAACSLVAAACAALVLRASFRAGVESMCDATNAIAAGAFGHRIGSRRADELGRLSASIDHMAARLDRLEQARRRTLACVSHELRTPMTIIRGHAFTLARDERDPGRRRRFALVEAEIVRLCALVDELVDAASMHAGGLRLERGPVDLRQFVGRVRRRFDEVAAESGVELRIRSCRRPAVVDADEGRLLQVLDNLLANAVRHCPGGTVELRIERGRDQHSVVVSDDGPGIDATVRDQLFEPFTQGLEHGAVGLGLAITHAIVEAHGGTIACVPTRQGATFRVQLPAAPGHHARRDARHGARRAARTVGRIRVGRAAAGSSGWA